MSFSDFLEQKVLEFVFGAGTLSTYASNYIGLCSGSPQETMDGSVSIVEIDGYTGYERQPPTWLAAAGGIISNTTTLTFGPAGATWPQVGYFIVMTHRTNQSNLLAYGTLSIQKTATLGDSISFGTSALRIQLQ